MLLAVDIGNTHTVFGVFRNDQLITEWRIVSAQVRPADEIRQTLEKQFRGAGISVSELDGVGISSVVPNLTGLFETLARKHLNIEPVIVSAALDLGFKIHYKDPMTVGADRICNAIAGYRKYGGPLIVIDFGTATTYTVVSSEGDFLGGAIALGLQSSADTLSARTAKLPKVDLRFPESAIGRDTIAGIQAGVMMGMVDSVEGMIRRIRSEIGQQAKVIATGGLASTISKQAKMIEACEPSLVLEGVRMIHERVKRK